MSLILPYPGKPANGDTLDASIVQANITAIAQAIQSFDASQVSPGTLTAAAFAASINPNTILKETTSPFVASGCVWSIVSGLQGTMSAGVVYVNGIRVSVGGVGSYNFTASQDTYVDIDYNGNVYYQAVANNAASPALTANAIRVAKVVTNASAISSISQTGRDSLFNTINPISSLLNGILDGQSQSSSANYIRVGKTLIQWGATSVNLSTAGSPFSWNLNWPIPFNSVFAAFQAVFGGNSLTREGDGTFEALSNTAISGFLQQNSGTQTVVVYAVAIGT